LDIDAMDSHGSTPLHIAYRNGASLTIVELLLRFGCHLDSVDAHGRTPVSYTKDESIIQLLTPRSKVDQLKCLCARLAAKDDSKSSFIELLPSALKKFVRLHNADRT
jgi:ankyrin repeat protein